MTSIDPTKNDEQSEEFEETVEPSQVGLSDEVIREIEDAIDSDVVDEGDDEGNSAFQSEIAPTFPLYHHYYHTQIY